MYIHRLKILNGANEKGGLFSLMIYMKNVSF